MDLFLGIDVSTTASKAILLSADGDVDASVDTAHTISKPRPLWSEQDPDMWWQAVGRSIRAVMSGVDAERVRGIGLTGQMHGLVALDDKGQVIRPAILWDDQRSAAQCDAIRERLGLAQLVAATGNDAYPGFTLPKLLWVRDNEPEHYARIAQVLLPKDYVRYRLSGEYATDRAGAGGTLMLDLKSRDWSAFVLDAFQIPRSWLPATHEGTEITSRLSRESARDLGLAPGTPIVGGGGDQAAQAVGVGAVDPGVVAITLGTSGVVFAATDEPVSDAAGAAHAFPHAVPGRWHMMGVMLSASGSLAWYRDALARDVSFEALTSEAAEAPAGCDGLTFLPYLSGERTPHADPFARGAFVGLTQVHNRSHLTRAVLEGVACGLRDNLDLLLKSGIEPPKSIRVSGGGTRSPLWLRIIANAVGVPLVTVESREGAALGAAMLAGVAVGAWPSAADAAQRCVRITGDVTPGSNDAVQEDLQARYRELYRALRPTFRTTFKSETD